ncbi:Uu.00g026900.m01.CDS01 [Anthostomella pinea]|uniref:Uu.00g026900.m01.CDS01 n=1 Tax=Anthostomella pinea TaxID=933095 RepID=A0AAI8V848_9PEZI|nr:Uu.00g026900.m01.CDS01 [Anthostomella pinea]
MQLTNIIFACAAICTVSVSIIPVVRTPTTLSIVAGKPTRAAKGHPFKHHARSAADDALTPANFANVQADRKKAQHAGSTA